MQIYTSSIELNYGKHLQKIYIRSRYSSIAYVTDNQSKLHSFSIGIRRIEIDGKQVRNRPSLVIHHRADNETLVQWFSTAPRFRCTIRCREIVPEVQPSVITFIDLQTYLIRVPPNIEIADQGFCKTKKVEKHCPSVILCHQQIDKTICQKSLHSIN